MLRIENAQIAQDWRTRADSPLAWVRCENQAGAVEGEAGGYFAEAVGFSRRVYLKPAKPHSEGRKHARAAREKIAADLAHDLGLSVPPAQLTVRAEPLSGCESAVVVTLVMYPRQWPWEMVKRYSLDESPIGAALAKALAECSPFFVFNTWVAQTDHGDHPHNIVWGYNPENLIESEIIFLDYANSLGFNGSWKNGGWSTLSLAPFPQLMFDSLDHNRVRETLKSLENFPEDVINDVVGRIPNSHLEEEERQALREGLIGRRTLVRNVIPQSISTVEKVDANK